MLSKIYVLTSFFYSILFLILRIISYPKLKVFLRWEKNAKNLGKTLSGRTIKPCPLVHAKKYPKNCLKSMRNIKWETRCNLQQNQELLRQNLSHKNSLKIIIYKQWNSRKLSKKSFSPCIYTKNTFLGRTFWPVFTFYSKRVDTIQVVFCSFLAVLNALDLFLPS